MIFTPKKWILFSTAAALLAACGGGGGGPAAPTSSGSGSTPTPPSWVQGQFSPPATYAALCATPRTGTDPVTKQPC